jgi:anti-sigma regulatory factor (Ser/Thr protein kinase)
LVAHSALDRIGIEGNIAADKLEQAKMLVNEAIINAIEHAKTKKNQFKIEFDLTKDVLLIYVRDYGSGFNLTDIETPDIEEKIRSDYKRGWGIKIMQSMSDDFKIESDKHGTKIYMYLRLNEDNS